MNLRFARYAGAIHSFDEIALRFEEVDIRIPQCVVGVENQIQSRARMINHW
jgi:hypothetical protein